MVEFMTFFISPFVKDLYNSFIQAKFYGDFKLKNKIFIPLYLDIFTG